MAASDLRKDYLLSEAFELVGRRLFGSDWNGNELFADRAPSPERMRADRVPLVLARQEVEAAIAEVHRQIGSTLSEAKIRSLEQQREALYERRNELSHQLLSRPEPLEMNEWLYGCYQRKLEVEATLVDALRRGLVKAHDGRNRPIDNLLWGGHPYFGFDIELSAVRMPRIFGGRRFQPARIYEREFDEWLQSLQPRTASAERALEPVEQCRRQIRRWVETTGGAQQQSKKAYFKEARATIPKLTERTFESAWSQAAPEDWKRSGRRRWSKNPPEQR